MLAGLITAIQTLTILPCPAKGSERMADSLVWFPLVGLLIGGLVALAAGSGVWLGAWPAAVAAVILSVWLTRGLHLDGLADVTDAYYGAFTLERRLAIMKDPHIGSFGVIALVLALLVKFVALSHLTASHAWRVIPVAFVLARVMQVWMAVALPYARREGGKAEGFVKGARGSHLAVAALMGALVVIGLMPRGGWAPLLIAAVLGVALMTWMRRVFGGVTGDLLGMSSELTECILLFVLSVQGSRLDWG